MIAVAVWWGYLLAHPALLVWGALTALAVLTAAAIIRLTADPPGTHRAPRPVPRSRAGETRARPTTDVPGRDGKRPDSLHASASAGQHHATGHATVRSPGHPAGGSRPTWARKAIARRIQALRVLAAHARHHLTRDPSTEEREAMALWQLMREDDTGGFLALPAAGVTVKIGAGDVRAAGRTLAGQDDTGRWPSQYETWRPSPAAEARTKEAWAEASAKAAQALAGQDGPLPELPPDDLDASCTYRDEAPFASMLSDDTIARGMAAIVDGA